MEATQPTASDLHLLAVDLFPRYTKFIRNGADGLEDVLRTVFGLPPVIEKATGSRFLFRGSVVAGLLLHDRKRTPSSYLGTLTAWCGDHASDIENSIMQTL